MGELRDIFRAEDGSEWHCYVIKDMLYVEVPPIALEDWVLTTMWIPLCEVEYDVSNLGYRIWSDR